MPAVIAEQSRRWLDTPEAERAVAVPRASATVMLLREGADCAVEVFVLRCAAGMAFAPGMLAEVVRQGHRFALLAQAGAESLWPADAEVDGLASIGPRPTGGSVDAGSSEPAGDAVPAPS